MLARPKPSEVSLASSIYWNLDQVKTNQKVLHSFVISHFSPRAKPFSRSPTDLKRNTRSTVSPSMRVS